MSRERRTHGTNNASSDYNARNRHNPPPANQDRPRNNAGSSRGHSPQGGSSPRGLDANATTFTPATPPLQQSYTEDKFSFTPEQYDHFMKGQASLNDAKRMQNPDDRSYKLQEALKSFTFASQTSMHISIIHKTAEVYLLSQNYTEAIRYFSFVLNQPDWDPRYEPFRSYVYHGLGHAYSMMGDKRKAEESYLKAIALNNHFIESLFNLGELKREADDKTALDYYDKAFIALDARKDLPSEHVAYYKKTINDSRDAIKFQNTMINYVTKPTPKHPAMALYEKTLSEFNRAEQTNEHNNEILLDIINNFENAINNQLPAENRGGALYYSAKIYQKLGRYHDIEELWERFNLLTPQNQATHREVFANLHEEAKRLHTETLAKTTTTSTKINEESEGETGEETEGKLQEIITDQQLPLGTNDTNNSASSTGHLSKSGDKRENKTSGEEEPTTSLHEIKVIGNESEGETGEETEDSARDQPSPRRLAASDSDSSDTDLLTQANEEKQPDAPSSQHVTLDSADALYRAKNYSEAIASYEQLSKEEKTKKDPIVFYRLAASQTMMLQEASKDSRANNAEELRKYAETIMSDVKVNFMKAKKCNLADSYKGHVFYFLALMSQKTWHPKTACAFYFKFKALTEPQIKAEEFDLSEAFEKLFTVVSKNIATADLDKIKAEALAPPLEKMAALMASQSGPINSDPNRNNKDKSSSAPEYKYNSEPKYEYRPVKLSSSSQ